MFDSSADVYDLFYDAAGKNYSAETSRLNGLIQKHCPAAQRVLDIACGTGRHLELLPDHLDKVGLDVEFDLLEVARRRMPESRFLLGDMTMLDLQPEFDVITCLFASISYARTVDGLRATIAGMGKGLRPGGILIIESGYTPSEWRTDLVGAIFADAPGVKGARIGRSVRRGNIAVLDLEYLIGVPGGIRHTREQHELGLFEAGDYETAFRRAAMTAQQDVGLTSLRRTWIGCAV